MREIRAFRYFWPVWSTSHISTDPLSYLSGQTIAATGVSFLLCMAGDIFYLAPTLSVGNAEIPH
jgi:hypothetical protein